MPNTVPDVWDTKMNQAHSLTLKTSGLARESVYVGLNGISATIWEIQQVMLKHSRRRDALTQQDKLVVMGGGRWRSFLRKADI